MILEFGTLSRLTGDDKFEKAARKVGLFLYSFGLSEQPSQKAFYGIWNRKSDIGLVGNTINTRTGVSPTRNLRRPSLTSNQQKWTAPELSGIGAGIDSFYEYALKWYIMTGEVEYLDVFDDAYTAIVRYSRAPDGSWVSSILCSRA